MQAWEYSVVFQSATPALPVVPIPRASARRDETQSLTDNRLKILSWRHSWVHRRVALHADLACAMAWLVGHCFGRCDYLCVGNDPYSRHLDWTAERSCPSLIARTSLSPGGLSRRNIVAGSCNFHGLMRFSILLVCLLEASCWAQNVDSPELDTARQDLADALALEDPQEMSAMLEEVVEIATTGIAKSPPTEQLAELYAIRANARLSQDLPDLAVGDLTAATDLAPEVEKYWFLRAFANEVLGNYSQAIDDLSRVIEMEPSNERARGNRATLLMEVGNYELAIVDLNSAIAVSPDDFGLFALRGDAFAETGQLSQAIGDYRSALAGLQRRQQQLFGTDSSAEAYDPEEVRLNLKLGMLHEQQGNREEAVRSFRSVLALEPNNGSALEALERLN